MTQLFNGDPVTADWRAVAEKQFAALQVIGLNVKIREFLVANDPMALKQIGRAVDAYRAALEAEGRATE